MSRITPNRPKFRSAVSNHVLNAAAKELRILAHPLRLRILECLNLASRPMTVGEVTKQLRRPQHAISHHLNLLHLHGILSRRRKGREVFYSARSRQALKILHWVQLYRDEEEWTGPGEAI